VQRVLRLLSVVCPLIAPCVVYADTNPTPIAVPLLELGVTGPQPGSPYPSMIDVVARGGPAQTSDVIVTLHKVTHPCPEDLAVLLVHGSARHLLMANAGSCRPLQGTDIVIMGGQPALPDTDPLTSPHGATLTIGPSVYGPAPAFPEPAPASPYVNGLPPFSVVQGLWELYVLDTRATQRGVIAGGWSLTYQTQLTSSPTVGGPIAVPVDSSGRAATYPIEFNLTTVPVGVKVRRMQFGLQLTHTWPDDLHVVLQSPRGTAVVLMANAGGDFDVIGQTIFFSDIQPSHAPDHALLSTSYKPGSVYETPIASLPAPAPPAPYGTEFAAFEGEDVRGTWRLWVYDDFPDDGSGTVSGLLLIETEKVPVVTINEPTLDSTLVVNRPFVHLEAELENLGLPRNVSWVNRSARGFYDAGAMTFLSPTRVTAEVPLERGENVITVQALNTQGVSAQDTLRITVNEFTYQLAEGATGAFFDEDITLTNPSGADAPVRIDFLLERGPSGAFAAVNVPAHSPHQIAVDSAFPDDAISAVVHSTNAVPLAVERTMSWDANGYGGHGGTSTSPNTRWLFAEGSQGYFHTYVLLANDNAASVDVAIRFLLEGGGVVTHPVSVPARQRVTVHAGDIPALRDLSFGIEVIASDAIIAERSMYFPSGGARLFEGGHESPGVNATSTRWFLAEGATGPFFDCFILLSNPTGSVAHTTLTYLLTSGETITQTLDVPANGRSTVNVETVDARLANTPVSTTVTSDVGIIVERSMYWTDDARWREAHNSLGVTVPALRWGVADGRIGGPRGHQTYILLANPNPRKAEVMVSFLKGGVRGPTLTYTLQPTSRLNIWANGDVPGLGDGVFSADVQVLNYQPIVVEKAMYWNSGGEVWAAGTNVVATPLPPP
jgi:hypothetical protein